MSRSNNGSEESRKALRRQGRHRFLRRLDVLITLVLAAVLTFLLNVLSFHHFRRVDLSASQYYSLSEQSVKIVKALQRPVEIFVLMERDAEGYEDVDRLLREYASLSDFLKIQFVDLHRNLARAEEIAGRFNLEEENLLVVAQGDRRKVIHGDDLYTRHESGTSETTAITSFQGEQLISSAIGELSEGKTARVYFLSGHGEHDPVSFDPYRGYSGVFRAMEQENLEVLPLPLGELGRIPPDADALVIAGPIHPLDPSERALIQAYLERSGRVIFLLDAYEDAGLKPLLQDWGIDLRDDLVVDATRTLTGKELFLTRYLDHPITRPLLGVTSVLYLPRSVLPSRQAVQNQRSADHPTYTALAACSENGWAETDRQENPKRFDPARDTPGPVPVAAAVERGPVPGLDMQLKPTRIVVFGDSDFVSNAGLNGGDIDLFMNSLDWVLERELLMSIRPRRIETVKLVLDHQKSRQIIALTALGLPLVAGLCGLIVWLVRRRT